MTLPIAREGIRVDTILSAVSLRGALCLRACITGFETTEDDVDALVAMLARARSRYGG